MIIFLLDVSLRPLPVSRIKNGRNSLSPMFMQLLRKLRDIPASPRYVLLLACFLSFGVSFGQKYSSVNYTQKDGLPVSQVQAIAQDKSGYLWVATGNVGLSKFDGRTFQNFQISHGLNSSNITALKYSRDTLWIGTTRGLNFWVNDSIYNDSRLGEPRVITMIESGSDDEIFIATPDSGVFCLSAKHGMKRYTRMNGFSNDAISDIEYDERGRAWMMTSGGDIFTFQDGVFTREFHTQTQALSIYCFKDTLLIGTESKLQYHIKQRGQWKLVKEKEIKSEIFDIQAHDGELWLSVRDGLLWQKKDSFLWLSDQNGLTNTPVISLYKDREGILWAGTLVQGLYKILREPFKQIQIAPLSLNDVMRDIQQIDENTTIISTLGKGAFVVDQRLQVKKLDLPSELRNIYGVRQSPDGLMILSYEGGLGHFRDGHYTTTKIPSSINLLMMVGETEESPLSSGKDIFMWSTKSMLIYRNGQIREHKLTTESPVICKLSLDSGVLLGTSQGLALLQKDSLTSVKTNTALDQVLIDCLARDSHSNIFVGTSGHGLWILPQGDASRMKRMSDFPVDIIRAILVDGDKVYCGTPQGLYILTMDERGKISDIVWMNRDNGFMGIECMRNGIRKNTDGRIWVGTINGAFVFDPDSYRSVSAQPKVIISRIKNVKTHQTYFENSAPPAFAHNQADLTVEFQGISLLNPHTFRYQYRLVGQTDQWSFPTSQTQAQFTNLPPGDYVFEVRIIDFLNREIGRTEAAFSVAAPFWKKAWFIILILVLFIGLIYSVLQFRIRKALKLQQEKDNINRELRRELARDFHDELGNHLASILSLLQVLKLRTPNLPANLKQPVALLEKKAQDLFFGTKDFIYSIDPENETLEWTILYLKDFGEQLFGTTQTRFETEPIRDWQKSITVKSYFARGIIMIFKESMTNIVKHAQANQVTFEISRKGKLLRFVLFDDGIGFDQEKIETSEGGLRNIRERAVKLGANLHVHSQKFTTTLTLEIENYAHWSK
jgi:signal transduction histidine kinase/ligand-binding sensor domain-containing protein